MRRLGGRAGAGCGALVSAVAVFAVCGTPAAHADGERDVPDVAMVVAGGTGRTTVLRSGEAAFACLRRLLAPTYTGTERVPEDWDEGHYPPVHFTVVWGLSGVGGWPRTDRAPGGDVAVERQDQLLVAADGTPWIRSDPAPQVRDDDIRWHRAPRSVFVELEREKVLSGLGSVSGTGEDSTGKESVAGRSAVRWGLSGLGAGLVAGVGGTLLIRRAAARHGAGPPRDEPRQELIDL
ncbi:hypothetical protein ACIRJO_30860 [Streptomyces sp. NPDC102394]|uniref:hypothetical protein n=1 Tax=Streptomyces sp. NPDC102394 TaxID=3366167 RepID=UPI0037F3EEF4